MTAEARDPTHAAASPMSAALDPAPPRTATTAAVALAGSFCLAGSLWLWSSGELQGTGAWAFLTEQRANAGLLSRLWWAWSDLGHGYVVAMVAATLVAVFGSRRYLQDASLLIVGAGLLSMLLKVCVDRA